MVYFKDIMIMHWISKSMCVPRAIIFTNATMAKLLAALLLFVMDHLQWQSLLAKLSATATRNSHVSVTTVLALATLGGAT